MPKEFIGDRFTKIRMDMKISTPAAMSKHVGVGINAWKLYESGEGTPSWATLEKLAELGFSPSWILTGNGPMKMGTEGDRPSMPVDARFMARVAVAVADAYHQAGQPVSDAARAMEEHAILSAILAEAQHPEEYEDQLELEKKRLRRRLAEARVNPGKGKASA